MIRSSNSPIPYVLKYAAKHGITATLTELAKRAGIPSRQQSYVSKYAAKYGIEATIAELMEMGRQTILPPQTTNPSR